MSNHLTDFHHRRMLSGHYLGMNYSQLITTITMTNTMANALKPADSHPDYEIDVSTIARWSLTALVLTLLAVVAVVAVVMLMNKGNNRNTDSEETPTEEDSSDRDLTRARPWADGDCCGHRLLCCDEGCSAWCSRVLSCGWCRPWLSQVRTSVRSGAPTESSSSRDLTHAEAPTEEDSGDVDLTRARPSADGDCCGHRLLCWDEGCSTWCCQALSCGWCWSWLSRVRTSVEPEPETGADTSRISNASMFSEDFLQHVIDNPTWPERTTTTTISTINVAFVQGERRERERVNEHTRTTTTNVADNQGDRSERDRAPAGEMSPYEKAVIEAQIPLRPSAVPRLNYGSFGRGGEIMCV